jgi:hypothetical protein
MRRPNRTIDDITCELRSTLKGKIVEILIIGGLLAEAKERIPPGEWLPWLKNEFSMSERSAQKCMEVATYVLRAVAVGKKTLAQVRAAKTSVKADELAQLGKLLTDIANLKKLGAAQRPPTPPDDGDFPITDTPLNMKSPDAGVAQGV